MNKNMIEYKDNFSFKIKEFFRNLFGRKEYTNEAVIDKKEIVVDGNNFKRNIEVKPDVEKIRIIELQKEYKAGNITEEDLTDDEYFKLIELYKEQNKNLQNKIDIKKQQIRKKLDNIKAS